MIAVFILAAITGAAWLGLLIDMRRARRQPPAVMPPRASFAPCGCLCSPGIVLVPCAAHDLPEPPVEQWAAEMEDQ